MQSIEINLPPGLDPDDVKALRAEIEASAEVQKVDSYRSDASAMMIIQSAAPAVAALVPLIGQLVGIFRKKGVGGARITLPDGTVIEASNASPEQIRALIAAAGG